MSNEEPSELFIGTLSLCTQQQQHLQLLSNADEQQRNVNQEQQQNGNSEPHDELQRRNRSGEHIQQQTISYSDDFSQQTVQQNSVICTLSNTQRNGGTKTTTTNKGWIIIVQIGDEKVEFQVDTGADANVLSQWYAECLGLAGREKSTETTIRTFSGERLPITGKVEMDFIYQNRKYCDYFYIVNLNCRNIIGLNLAVKMNLVKTVGMLSTENIVEQNSDIFEGLGLIERECNLVIKPNVDPVIGSS